MTCGSISPLLCEIGSQTALGFQKNFSFHVRTLWVRGTKGGHASQPATHLLSKRRHAVQCVSGWMWIRPVLVFMPFYKLVTAGQRSAHSSICSTIIWGLSWVCSLSFSLCFFLCSSCCSSVRTPQHHMLSWGLQRQDRRHKRTKRRQETAQTQKQVSQISWRRGANSMLTGVHETNLTVEQTEVDRLRVWPLLRGRKRLRPSEVQGVGRGWGPAAQRLEFKSNTPTLHHPQAFIYSSGNWPKISVWRRETAPSSPFVLLSSWLHFLKVQSLKASVNAPQSPASDFYGQLPFIARTWTFDVEWWQWDRQVPLLPLGHPPCPLWLWLGLGKVGLSASIAAPAAAGSSWQSVGRSSMQETDLPATNAFKGKHS